MNLSKLTSLIDNARSLVQELENLALSTTRVQVCVIWDEVMTYVHFWDPRNDEPRIVFCERGQVEDAKIKEASCQALNLLSHSAFKLGVEWVGDYPWDSLPENFQKLQEIFDLEKKDINLEQKQIIGRSPHVIHHLQSKLSLPEAN